jgi:hypothetical protein
MNGWAPGSLIQMTRGTTAQNNATFTWTGTVPLQGSFRMTNSATIPDNWTCDWIAADHANNNNWVVHPDSFGAELPAARIPNTTTDKNWEINSSEATYTIVYNAATRKLTITKQ